MFKADGATLVRDRPLHSVVWKFPDLFQLRLQLKLADDTLLPGQPLELQWRLNEGTAVSDGVAQARIFVDGHLVREHADVPVTSAQQGTGWVDEQKIAIQDPGVAAQIYRFGSRLIELEVRSGSGLHRARLPSTVIPDTFTLSWAPTVSWWTWQGSSNLHYEWKESFELVGDFVNRAKFARLNTVEVSLGAAYVDQTEPYVNPCELASAVSATATDLAPKATHNFRFPLYYDWEWLTPGVFVVGDVSKSYDYAVWIKATDQYGNVYEGCTPLVHRTITVSEEKWAFGMSAMGLTATAVAFAIVAAATSWTIIGGIGAAAAAAGAYAAAGSAAAKAYDPPAPDMDFRERAEPERPELPEWPRERGVPEMRAFRELLERTLQLLALEDARTVTRARLMGARVAEDEDATHLHEQAYQDLVSEMVELVAPAEEIAERARHELAEHPAFETDWLAEIDAFARRGFPPEIEVELRKLGASGHSLESLRRAAGSAALAELLEVNGLSLVQIAVALQIVVRAIESRSDEVLSGEEYVEPPGGLARIAIDKLEERATRAGRGKRCCCVQNERGSFT